MAPPKSEEDRQKLIREFREKTSKYIRPGYWTTDDYISKWLSEKSYKVDIAERAFRKMLKWRIDNKVEGVLSENFEDLYENVVYFLDGVDKKGRPILCIPCSECSVKDKLTVAGDKARLERVFYQILEKMVQQMKVNSEATDGAVSTFVVIVDVEGVDVKFVTPQVLGFVMQISKLCEENYPGMLEFAYIINASKAIKNIYTMVKTGLSSSITSRVHVYSNKRHKWEAAILENVDEDQLRSRFGGSLGI